MSRNVLELYKLWSEKAIEDKDVVEELAKIEGNENEINERFALDLSFGTAGLRGVIGAGTFRLNIYTIRKATQGFADYLNESFTNPTVAMAYDSRIKSDVFAVEASKVLAANGVKVYLYPELNPVPMLSYAVRELKCDGGIMITASHNPAKYNGYKVYGSDGCQMTSEAADIVLDKISKVDIFGGVKLADFDEAVKNGTVEYISNEINDKYLAEVMKRSVHPEVCKGSDIKIVYTPLNGAGNKPVRKVLDTMGFTDINIVKEQEMPDGNFPTCPFPNPEITEALDRGLKLSKEIGAELLLATDPDCDRVGIAVKSDDDYVLFSGNEVGALLLEYICEERTNLGTMPKNPMAVKTIVTTEICKKIADNYGVKLVDVLTGFKYIGEQIAILEEKGEEESYLLGFEESYGYLSGTYVRDKDAVVGSMLICEMAAFYKSKGISLIEARENMYKKYGVYKHSTLSFEFEGVTGMEKMAGIMSELRNNPPMEIAGFKVVEFSDYVGRFTKNIATGETTEITLPVSDILVFALDNEATVIARPSGTEPKLKAYYTTVAKTFDEALAIEATIQADFKGILKI